MAKLSAHGLLIHTLEALAASPLVLPGERGYLRNVIARVRSEFLNVLPPIENDYIQQLRGYIAHACTGKPRLVA